MGATAREGVERFVLGDEVTGMSAELLSPNFTRGRGGKRVLWIIIHTTEGSFSSSVNWLRNPASRASAHYVVGRDSATDPVRVVQLVKEEDTAWTAGNYAVNQASINIELVGYSHRNPPVDEETLRAAAALTRQVAQRHNVPLRRVDRRSILAGVPGICGHADVPDPNDPRYGGGEGRHTDPGPFFPWERFLAMLGSTVEDPTAVVAVGPFGCHLGGGFRRFWEERGGVSIFGWPITEEFQENGVTVQYFERARFEHRPDIGKAEDYHVVLGRIGAELLELRQELQRMQQQGASIREEAKRLASTLQVAVVETRERVAVLASLAEQLRRVFPS